MIKQTNSYLTVFGTLKTLIVGSVGFMLLAAPLSGWATQAALLVSLGMPDAALKAYLAQGRRYHIPVVIRGLYGVSAGERIGESRSDTAHSTTSLSAVSSLGSFRATAIRLQQLMKDQPQFGPQGGVVIDPRLFSAFNVTVVPALVVYDTPLTCLRQVNKVGPRESRQAYSRTHHPCAAIHYDVVRGNLPLPKLLRIAEGSHHVKRSAYAHELRDRYGTNTHKKSDKDEKDEKNEKREKKAKNETSNITNTRGHTALLIDRHHLKHGDASHQQRGCAS